MNISGFSILNSNTKQFTDNLNLEFKETGEYQWTPAANCSGNLCTLDYLKVKFKTTGIGKVDIYLLNGQERLLIYSINNLAENNSEIVQENTQVNNTAIVSEDLTDENSTIIQEYQNEENQTIIQEDNLTENLTIIGEQSSDFLITGNTIREFESENDYLCNETCNLDIPFLGNYTLLIEQTGEIELFLDSINYGLKMSVLETYDAQEYNLDLKNGEFPQTKKYKINNPYDAQVSFLIDKNLSFTNPSALVYTIRYYQKENEKAIQTQDILYDGANLSITSFATGIISINASVLEFNNNLDKITTEISLDKLLLEKIRFIDLSFDILTDKQLSDFKENITITGVGVVDATE
jgi:hypothetical protein